ncbi:hypothetical protein NUW54_g9999 [Trametes sanguinea]|uniref:Uncharacterized protein n=1 Tax=Trametes sanguinea TaxID=158606 RepID=A0ACC1P4W9_9APHY|nr:hypothetical protein NUW54_g9999 [Trametes sanguinea]
MRRFGSLTTPGHKKQDELSASDVWYFLYAIETREEPPQRPVNQPRLRVKPSTPAVACRLCTGKWQTWKCAHGQTTLIREHLQKLHYEEWSKSVITEKLKGWENLMAQSDDSAVRGRRSSAYQSEPFTPDGFLRRLGNVIAEENLSIQIVDSEALRDLILYASTAPELLEEGDIPHRTHMHKLLIKRYASEIQKLRHDLQGALGRISFTCDLWSCRVLKGFMAVTLHYCAKDQTNQLVLQTWLGAFRHIKGSHTGPNLARHFVGILEELGILHKIGVITMDNGSNCGTMLDDLERILTEKGIRFDRKGNRIRCFPHVVNISVQRGLRALGCATKKSDLNADDGDSETLREFNHNDRSAELETQARHTATELVDPPLHVEAHAPASADPSDPTFDEFEAAHDPDFNDALQDDLEYAAALSQNPVKAARTLINKARQSGQRREEFEHIVAEGIRTQLFGESNEPRGRQLLRDVDTRWSSTFLMIDRLLSLYPAVQLLMNKHDRDALLSDKQLDVLSDIREFLSIPHAVQELLSSENAPTASLALPAYTELIEILKGAKVKLPHIGHGIQAAIGALEQYMAYTRQTRVYALAMVINPTLKFMWLQENWRPNEVETARGWLIDAVNARVSHCSSPQQHGT